MSKIENIGKIGNLVKIEYIGTDGIHYKHEFKSTDESTLTYNVSDNSKYFLFLGKYTKRGIENMKKIKSNPTNPKKQSCKMSPAARKAWGAKMKAARAAKKHENPKSEKPTHKNTLHNGKKIKPSLGKIVKKLKNLFEDKTGYYHSPTTIKKLIKTVQNWNPGNISIFDAYKLIIKEYGLRE